MTECVAADAIGIYGCLTLEIANHTFLKLDGRTATGQWRYGNKFHDRKCHGSQGIHTIKSTEIYHFSFWIDNPILLTVLSSNDDKDELLPI